MQYNITTSLIVSLSENGFGLEFLNFWGGTLGRVKIH